MTFWFLLWWLKVLEEPPLIAGGEWCVVYAMRWYVMGTRGVVEQVHWCTIWIKCFMLFWIWICHFFIVFFAHLKFRFSRSTQLRVSAGLDFVGIFIWATHVHIVGLHKCCAALCWHINYFTELVVLVGKSSVVSFWRCAILGAKRKKIFIFNFRIQTKVFWEFQFNS